MIKPIKKCDYCSTTGHMATYFDGETICNKCIDRLPIGGRKARQRLFALEQQVNAITEAAHACCDPEMMAELDDRLEKITKEY